MFGLSKRMDKLERQIRDDKIAAEVRIIEAMDSFYDKVLYMESLVNSYRSVLVLQTTWLRDHAIVALCRRMSHFNMKICEARVDYKEESNSETS